MKKEIKTTKNYLMFGKSKENRPVVTENNHYKRIYRSMDEHGFLIEYPIVVYKNKNGMLEIFDGQHRFEAAKALEIEIAYVVIDEPGFAVANLNSTQTPWSPMDYVNSYICQGKKDYGILKDYVVKNNLSLMSMAAVLGGEGARPGESITALVKNGKFKVIDTTKADAVVMIISQVRPFFKHATDRNFLIAATRCLFVPEFSVLSFIEKSAKFYSLFKACANVEQYTEMIEEIYNFKCRNRIPLKHLADEAARKRWLECGEEGGNK